MKKGKILAPILALAMMLIAMILPITASAAGTASITVNAFSGLTITAGDFSAYKLFDVTTSGTAPNINYAYTPVQPAVDNFLASTYNAGNKYGTTAAAFQTWLGTQADDAASLTALTNDLAASGFFAAITPPTQVSGTSVKFSNLDYGYYLVVGKGTAADGTGTVVVAHSTLVTVDSQNPNATVNLKADVPTLTKEVKNHNTDAWSNWTDVNIGDTVDFQLTSKVPNMAGYTSYKYIVHDTLSAGLTMSPSTTAAFEANGVTVTIGGASFTDFVTKVTGQSFTVTFGSTFINQTKDAAIIVTYSATLNANAVMAPASNDNTAYLEYSNNPYDTSETGTTPPSTPEVFTFQFNIDKVDGNNTSTHLAGAVFNVRTVSGSDASALKFSIDLSAPVGDATHPAVYVLDPVNGSIDITTPASGQIDIKGLDAGTYYLYEKTAPDGFNKLTAEENVVISHTVTAGISNYVTLIEQVKNFAGTELPHTGGIGTTIFYVIGAALAAGIVVFFVIRRRKSILKMK